MNKNIKVKFNPKTKVAQITYEGVTYTLQRTAKGGWFVENWNIEVSNLKEFLKIAEWDKNGMLEDAIKEFKILDFLRRKFEKTNIELKQKIGY